eukprot:943490-Rhodomonas_salina.2
MMGPPPVGGFAPEVGGQVPAVRGPGIPGARYFAGRHRERALVSKIKSFQSDYFISHHKAGNNIRTSQAVCFAFQGGQVRCDQITERKLPCHLNQTLTRSLARVHLRGSSIVCCHTAMPSREISVAHARNSPILGGWATGSLVQCRIRRLEPSSISTVCRGAGLSLCRSGCRRCRSS